MDHDLNDQKMKLDKLEKKLNAETGAAPSKPTQQVKNETKPVKTD